MSEEVPVPRKGFFRRHPIATTLLLSAAGIVVLYVAWVAVGLAAFLYNNPEQMPGLSSCQSSTLSASCAQRTLSRWIASSGSVTVSGVQDVPQQSAALAQITLSDYKYTNMGRQLNYSGSGTASFVRYNDGRWMLTRVDFAGGQVWVTNINLEAK